MVTKMPSVNKKKLDWWLRNRWRRSCRYLNG